MKQKIYVLLLVVAALDIIKDSSGKKLCFVESIEPEWFIKYLDTVKKQQK